MAPIGEAAPNRKFRQKSMLGLVESIIARLRSKCRFVSGGMGIDRTTLVASVFGLGLFATLVAAARWQPHHIGKALESMHAPSRSAPSRLTGASMQPMQIGLYSTQPPSPRP